MKIATAIATLLLTATLGAQQAHVDPLAPTTATPIEVHYLSGCRSTHTVTREGTSITIAAHEVQCDGTAHAEKVKLPELLPIGSYDVEIVGEHDPFYLLVGNRRTRHFRNHRQKLIDRNGWKARVRHLDRLYEDALAAFDELELGACFPAMRITHRLRHHYLTLAGHGRARIHGIFLSKTR